MFKWKLAACRVQAGFTQKEVAKELGITEVTVVKYETGKTAVSMERAMQMSQLYGIPLEMMDFTRIGNTKIR